MNWQRATTNEKKSERKAAICDAALTLFNEQGYEKVTFNGIASKAGFTKSNMYRYFSSKEEIFLVIFSELFEAWFQECVQRLQQLPVQADKQAFAELWVTSHKQHRAFLELTPLLFVSLECNSSYEQLLRFKGFSMDLLFQLATEIGRVYPALAGEKSFEFLTLSFAATANYWAAESKQNDALKQIYALEQFSMLKPNFDKSLTTSVAVILHGLHSNETNT